MNGRDPLPSLWRHWFSFFFSLSLSRETNCRNKLSALRLLSPSFLLPRSIFWSRIIISPRNFMRLMPVIIHYSYDSAWERRTIKSETWRNTFKLLAGMSFKNAPLTSAASPSEKRDLRLCSSVHVRATWPMEHGETVNLLEANTGKINSYVKLKLVREGKIDENRLENGEKW